MSDRTKTEQGQPQNSSSKRPWWKEIFIDGMCGVY
jgi:hypothetical protein